MVTTIGTALRRLVARDDAEHQLRAIRAALVGSRHTRRPRAARSRSTTDDTRAALENPPPVAHLPRRPWWTCRECQRPWPCPAGKVELINCMARRTLAIYMGEQMAKAIKDMPRPAAGALWTRFIAWTNGNLAP